MPRRSRSRSRSPSRRERRSSRERERRRHRRSRSRSPRRKSRSPHRSREHRSRSPRHKTSTGPGDLVDLPMMTVKLKERKEKDRERESTKAEKVVNQQPIDLTEDDFQGLPHDEADMMKIMGFGNFDSTKGKKVNGNDIYVANIPKKRRYRQYMNRRGGFNRPLDFIA
ncbi:U4/U6.U5 small nuclear ribonucleoprotein 27 kDa protein-like isoform X1 [Crassostrea virginica]|uniref:U4/U6.U5 small nuclear ribonucleoprotein 27 kDa protein n=1 Tax=Crassostrea virginica TaxID=6565 RepID=A0A8B8ABC5_CRAVI|nr:U4/U6.U5 small nuclear ribonucleoprotein 27 kDa protein-like isoform X1 [Crassostrea virginica]